MEIIRIVRMSFDPDHVTDFLAMFAERYLLIRHFEGCISLRLMKDQQHPNVFYTISEWKSAKHLDQYRHSELFKDTWGLTRSWFNDKPQAFSLQDVGIPSKD